ncbi:MAG TPA: 50S ribosomal protein L15 [Kiritimatiellia bacterium]|nr:50S ribosomal protein L15 [Kiritimatiellia bacterium]
MQLHTITNVKGAVRRKKRLGCGESSGHGKTSGKGNKGQMARSGHKRKALFEGGQMPMPRRIPKRGFNRAFRTVFAPVNVGTLSRFEAGSTVDAMALHQAGLIPSAKASVKILGNGELSVQLTVKAHAYSQSAKTKIEAAGGQCEVVA